MNNKRKHPKTRQAELTHHLTYDESLESQLSRLHIKVLSHGKIPDSYLAAYQKGSQGKTLSNDELKKVELLSEYLERFDMPAVKSDGSFYKWFTHWQKRLLLAFCDFIDDPVRCHQGRLLKLHKCKSAMKSLQHKQRVTIIELVTTLFTRMNVETLSVGQYGKDESEQLKDTKGNVLMRGITHGDLRGLYHRLWNKPISKTKYHDTLNMLKLAGFFEVEACYIDNEEAEVKRAELKEKGATKEEIEAIPSIYSEAAYKWFTFEFIEVFGIIHKDDMIESKKLSIAKRLKAGLSNLFATYKPFSNSFWTKKRKDYLSRAGKRRYPQANPSMIDNQLPELVPLRH